MTRILLIDDAEDILELAAIGLEIAGLACATAKTGEQALACLQEESFDLILLDYQLGQGESGLDVLRRIRKSSCQTPVVFLTAAADEAHRAQFMGSGAVGVLHKPFDPMTLGHSLRPWLTQT